MKYRIAAPVVQFIPATPLNPGLFKIECPFGCVETTPTGRPKRNGGPKLHTHGAGRLGADHRSFLGHREAHCATAHGGGYVLIDPDGLVPARLKSVGA